jgi:6-phosphogluconolactonase (cycloisomerase 2 family)
MQIWRNQSGEKICVPARTWLSMWVIVLLALFIFLPGCSSPKIRFGYVATGQGVFAFRIDAGTGAASEIFGSPFVTKTNANFAASASSAVVHPSNGVVYVANQDINSISRFKIDSTTGALTELTPRTPLTNSSGGVGLSPAFMIMDTVGKFLFVANTGTNDVWVFSIGDSGTLTFVSRAQLADSPSSLTLSASGNLLYVPVPTLSAIYVFSVSAGTLTQVGSPFRVSGGVGNLGIDPKASFLFVPNPSTNTVTVLRIQANGTLAFSAGAFATGTTPLAAATNPSGTFLYVANSGSANLSQFQLNTSTGELTALTNSVAATGTQPSQIILDPDTKFIFVVNQQSNTISEFSQNSDGTLFSNGSQVTLNVLPRSFSITK